MNEAVEAIVLYKGNLIKGADDYTEYIVSVLTDHRVVFSETSQEEVGVLVRVFTMGAVDAMIFDVAGTLNLPDRTMRNRRRAILNKRFLGE